MARQLSLAVVGIDYENKRGPSRRFEISMCLPGEPVDLIPEPRNPADSRAVKVVSDRGIQIGYLTAERCGWIKSLIERGDDVRSVFQAATHWGAWIRVSLDGSDPLLPPPSAAGSDSPEDDTGFYPDPIWDDD